MSLNSSYAVLTSILRHTPFSTIVSLTMASPYPETSSPLKALLNKQK